MHAWFWKGVWGRKIINEGEDSQLEVGLLGYPFYFERFDAMLEHDI